MKIAGQVAVGESEWQRGLKMDSTNAKRFPWLNHIVGTGNSQHDNLWRQRILFEFPSSLNYQQQEQLNIAK